VCDTDSQAVEEIRKKGIDSLDVVIANAAVNLGCGVGFKDVDVDLQEETFRINVSYPSLSQSPLPHLLDPAALPLPITVSIDAITPTVPNQKLN